jgi:hypothetical protein
MARPRSTIRRMIRLVAVVAILLAVVLMPIRLYNRWLCVKNAESFEGTLAMVERQIADPTDAQAYPAGSPPAFLQEQASRLRWFARGWRLRAVHPPVGFGQLTPVLGQPDNPRPPEVTLPPGVVLN